jgi:hypothetical protein
MYHSLFTYAGGCFSAGTARRSLTRAAGLAAITVLMLGTLSGPAGAQATNTPLRAFFTKLTCNQQSDDNIWPNPDHDEPYLVFFAADLRDGTASGRVFLKAFVDVDTNGVRDDSLQLWPLYGGSGSPIGSEDDYIFLVALLESDDVYNLLHMDTKVASVLLPKLTAYHKAGMSRGAMVSSLRTDMDLAIEVARKAKGDADDRVGPVFEILWGTEWLPAARSGQTVFRSAVLVGNGSTYSLEFQLRP